MTSIRSVLIIAAAVACIGSGAEIKVLIDNDGQLERQQRRFDHQTIQVQEVVSEDEDEVVIEIEKIEVAPDSKRRGLVPQLWKNYTGPYEPPAENVTCDIARQKCQYRAGCGLALQNYALGCMDLIEGESNVCNSHCRHSLIALMSTHEGQRLMKVSLKKIFEWKSCKT